MCTVASLQKITMIYYIFDALVRMLLQILFLRVNTRYGLILINIQNKR
jgi:hypothetical protein